MASCLRHFTEALTREFGNEFAVLWAGDSRAYLYRDGHLYQLTRDHTQVEAMLERGLLTHDQALDHPMKHVLARAVGVQEHLQIDAIRDAYRQLEAAAKPQTTTSAAASGPVPAYMTSQIANYQAALDRLTGGG